MGYRTMIVPFDGTRETADKLKRHAKLLGYGINPTMFTRGDRVLVLYGNGDYGFYPDSRLEFFKVSVQAFLKITK